MSPGPSIVVAGAGVFGAAVALALARGGARVLLADPAAPGDNASGVAAGMIAPAFEALLDPAAAGHFALLREARDLWPAFVGNDAAALDLRRCGALWLGLPGDPPDQIEAHLAGLRAMGAAAEPWSAGQIAERAPGLDPRLGPGLFTPEDWRVAPQPALAALLAMAEAAGVRRVRAAVIAFEGGRARLSTGEAAPADGLVAATGAEPSGLAPELAVLSPIKGQILRYPASRLAAAGPSLRCALGYASGGIDGLCVGATMEPGLTDRTNDPAAVERLGAEARALSPALAWAPVVPQAAVRGASPDGLPMAGPSARRGVWLAVGARRNGWLLAPLVAHMVAAYVAGLDAGPHAAMLDPRRFD